MEDKTEDIIIDLGQTRIRRQDQMNLVVEQRRPDDKWVFFGYFSNVKSALRSIYRSDLLVQERNMTLREYLEQDLKLKQMLLDTFRKLPDL